MVTKTKLKCVEEYSKELKKEAFKPKIIDKRNTFNTLINYSDKILSPYELLKSKFFDIIDRIYTKKLFYKGINGICQVIRSVLNHENSKWLISYENSKTMFHRKYNNEIELDVEANKFMNDIIPDILSTVKTCFHSIIDTPSDDDSLTFEIADGIYAKLKRISVIDSEERNQCVKFIIKNMCISNTELNFLRQKHKINSVKIVEDVIIL